MSDVTFSDLSLSADMLAALDEMGYETPTPVQESSVPMVATGRDLMVQSQTGTGKTAAFGIPMIDGLGDKPQGIQCLVLCPTRELAKQVAEEFNALCQFKKIQSVAVYGGASLEKQIAEMRFAHIVVGTPGRVLDHLRRKTLKLHRLRTLILDEADEMLSMGFARELEQIMSFVPADRQTLLFSATIPEDIKRYAKRYMKEPEFLSLIEESVGADDVEHHYYMVSGVARPRDLVKVLEFEAPESAIVFTNTRKDTEIVTRYLRKKGFDAEFLNGDLAQRERERVMGLMKDKSLRFLVATDIAARGIDISELSHVINYILPESPEVYIHRTGRTGRAGSKGTAISLIGPREIGVYYYLKRIYNVALQERPVPSKAEIELQRDERNSDAMIKRILDSVGGEAANDKKLRAQTLRLLERDDSVEIVQALLQVFHEGGTRTTERSVGGVLADIPKPDKIAPGARAQTLKSVADRVATVRGEFHGRPEKAAAEDAPKKASRRPAAKAQPEPEAPEVEAEEAAQEGEPPPRRRRRRRSAEESEPTPAAKAEASAEPEADEKPARNSRRRRPRTEEAAPEAVAAEEEAPKSRSRRSRGRSAEAAEPAAEATEQPRQSRRRGRKSEDDGPRPEDVNGNVKAAPVEDDDTHEQQPQDEQPRSRSRRGRRDEAPVRTPLRELAENEARLFVNIGRRDNFEPDTLQETLAELAGLLSEDIVDVDVRGRHSYVIVAREFADDVVEAVDGERINKREVRVEFARE